MPSADGMTLPLEAMLAAIDEETRLVSVSQVAFRSSYVQDLAAITSERTRWERWWWPIFTNPPAACR